MRWEAYHVPLTVEEALDLLARYQGRARVVGGGTDYFVDDIESDGPVALVDVTGHDYLYFHVPTEEMIIGNLQSLGNVLVKGYK